MYRRSPEKIRAKYPLLDNLDLEDIKFECVPHTVRLEMAKSIDPSTYGWKSVGEKMNISVRNLKYIAELKDNKGSNTMNMFHFYDTDGENSLRLFCKGLVEMGLEDVLHHLFMGWENVLKEHHRYQGDQKKCAVQNECYNSHENYTRSQTCSCHCQQQMIPSYLPSPHPCDRPSCACRIPMASWPAHTAPPDVQHKYNYTRDWVEHHSMGLPAPQSRSPHKDRKKPAPTEKRGKQVSEGPQGKVFKMHADHDIEMNDIKLEPVDPGMDSIQTDSSGLQSLTTSGSLPSFESNKSRGLSQPKRAEEGIYFRKGSPLNVVPKPQHRHLPPIQAFFPLAAPASGVPPQPQAPVDHRLQQVHPPPAPAPAAQAQDTQVSHNFNPYAGVTYGNVFQPLDSMDVDETPPRGTKAPDAIKEETSISKKSDGESMNKSDDIPIGSVALALAGPEGKRRMTIPMRRPDEIRLLEGRELSSPESSLDSLRRSLSSRGRIESGSFIDSLRNVSVFVTHLYHYWEDHPMEKQYSKCAVSLGKCLKENNFRIQMDVPNQSRVPQGEANWREWIDRKFQHANYILVCLSPTYLNVVNASHIEDTEDILDNIQSTRYVFHLMQHEFEENEAVNKRFLPILFSDIPRSDFPLFLQMSQVYRWTKDFEDLFWRLTQPDQTVSNILANQQG